MRQVINGSGADTTSIVQTMLANGNEFALRNVYLIGRPEDPLALWLTDNETPLCWPSWTSLKTRTPVVGQVHANAFDPTVITRGSVTSKFGLAVDDLDITWAPQPQPFGTTVDNANFFQLAQAGWFDNQPVRVWQAYLPTRQSGLYVDPNDCNTLGCMSLYGGRIGPIKMVRGAIVFTVRSFLDVVDRNVPLNVIEMTNTAAAFTGATPPYGQSTVPTMTCIAGSTNQNILATGVTFPDDKLSGGYIIWNPGSANAGFYGAIFANQTPSGHSLIVLYQPLPFVPQAGDTFLVSGPAPIDKADAGAGYVGFPAVPAPQSIGGF